MIIIDKAKMKVLIRFIKRIWHNGYISYILGYKDDKHKKLSKSGNERTITVVKRVVVSQVY